MVGLVIEGVIILLILGAIIYVLMKFRELPDESFEAQYRGGKKDNWPFDGGGFGDAGSAGMGG